MEFAILGPVEARVDGRLLPLGGPKPRALLAILLLHANEAVSRDRLIEGLWGERPPPSAAHSLDHYVSRLRRELGDGRIARRAPGYVLRIQAGELDLDRFESCVRVARDASAAGDATAAARLLRDGLALWRGHALADVLYEPFAGLEAERLEAQRLGAIEALIEAELESGADAELVPELERLVREHPLRERLLGQLMLALYRASRQADALAALQAARHRLADELGLEPGPEVRELERRILRHDPRLDPSPRKVTVRKRLPKPALVVAGVVALVTGATAVVLATGGPEPLPAGADGTSRLLAIASGSGEMVEAVELPGSPAAVALGAGSVWVVDPSGGTVSRVEPSSGAVVDRIPVSRQPGSIVSGGGAIWVATLGGTIERIDPATGSKTQTVRLSGANATAITFRKRSLWVADATDHALVEIDPPTGSVRRKLTLDLTPSAVAVGDGVIWVAGYDAGLIEAIDPASGQTVATVRVGQGPAALAVGRGAVWVANNLDATVSKIDPVTGAVVATIPVGNGPSAIALADGSIWVANPYSGTVSRIDPGRNQVVETVRVGGKPSALTAAAGRVWIGTGAHDVSHRGGNLTLVSTNRFGTIDPAFQEYTTSAFTRLGYDSLVTFEAAAGPAGLRLLPDLALAIPTPGRGGTTYPFRLRPGIRYSDGRPLRAGDFRRAIERLFRVDSPGASLFSGIVGTRACTQRPARCELARGIAVDEAARTVVFHLGAPDPDFLSKLTVLGFSAPIPPGTPDRDVGSRAVPGTGPYRIAAANRRGIRFVRNPFFREWSHAAQPDGNPDTILWRYASSPRAAVEDVVRGRADWVSGLIPPLKLRELRVRHRAQLHENPSFAVDFIPLNTQRPPFDDVRVRQALNYAVDRGKIARLYGSAAAATPLCQPLPPRFPGYRRYCPYTLHPRPDGRWTAPNLPRARRLVSASGTRGDRIDVWGTTDLAYVPRRLPAYVAQLLRSLGYRARLHLVPDDAFSPAMRRGLQLTVDGDWLPDYPAPSSFLPPFFSCAGGHNRRRYVCDRQLDRQMQRASTLELRDQARAAMLWTRIDHELVDRAIWVPTVNLGVSDFVSEHMRNYQYHPVWGLLADQVWLR